MSQKNKKNLVPISVNKTIYNVHPEVLSGIQKLQEQHNQLLANYHTALQMNSKYIACIKTIVDFIPADTDLTDEQRAAITEGMQLLGGSDQKKNEEHLRKFYELTKQVRTQDHGQEYSPEEKEPVV